MHDLNYHTVKKKSTNKKIILVYSEVNATQMFITQLDQNWLNHKYFSLVNFISSNLTELASNEFKTLHKTRK